MVSGVSRRRIRGGGVANVDKADAPPENWTMRTIAAAQFREECLAILDDVDPEGIVITKGGLPVARLIPVRESRGYPSRFIGALKGKGFILGDIESPVSDWETVQVTRDSGPSAEPLGPHAHFIGTLRGRLHILGDIESPVSGWEPDELERHAEP